MKGVSLRNQMLAWAVSLVFICSAAFVGATALYQYFRMPILIHEAQYSLQKHTLAQRLELEDWFDERTSDIARLANLKIFQSLQYEEMTDSLMLMRKHNQQYQYLVFGDAEGIGRADPIKGIVIRDRDYFQAATQGRSFISDILVGRATGTPVLAFSSPIQGEGGVFRGIVIGTVKADSIHRALQQASLLTPYKTGRSNLVSPKRMQLSLRKETEDSTAPGDKIILADQVGDLNPELLNQVMAGKSGTAVWTDDQGKRVISAFEYLPKQGWAVIRSVDETEILAPAYEQIELSLGLALLVFLLALPLAALAANTIRRPVEWLIAQSRLIRDGNLADVETNLDAVNMMEFQELCKTYREMAQTIRKQMKDLEDKNQDLADFAYVASHDLKAPLRGVSALAHWLEQDYADKLDSEGKSHIALMQGRIHRMEELLDGILRYSRIGRVEELAEWVDGNELLREIISDLHVPAHITVKVIDNLPDIWADPTRIRQVFENLIDNAVKFIDTTEGKVEIGCRPVDTFWEFFVRDNGPGIEPAYYEKIFQLFQTLQPRDQYESTGLGLAIAKRIVELRGGKIRVTRNEAQGATFWFTWPRRAERREEGFEGVDE